MWFHCNVNINGKRVVDALNARHVRLEESPTSAAVKVRAADQESDGVGAGGGVARPTQGPWL